MTQILTSLLSEISLQPVMGKATFVGIGGTAKCLAGNAKYQCH